MKFNMENETIGRRIKKLRKLTGYTAKEFAEKVGIPYSSYSNYENGNREPKLATLRKIATALNVSISQISNDEMMSKNFQDDFLVEIFASFQLLNTLGKKEAIKRLHELTQLPQYVKIRGERFYGND